MISFKEWLITIEARDPNLLPTGSVKLGIGFAPDSDNYDDEYEDDISNIDPPDNYYSTFKVDRVPYKVEMERTNDQLPVTKTDGVSVERWIDINNLFSVAFHGPKGFQTTGGNNAATARQVYDHLLASIWKMMKREKEEGREVNGFVFRPQESKMALIYDKFYKEYLRPNGFIKGSGGFIVRKNYLRELLKAEEKPKVAKQIRDNLRSEKEGLKKIRNLKALNRQAEPTLKRMIGHIVPFASHGTDGWANRPRSIGILKELHTSDGLAKVIIVQNGTGWDYSIPYKDFFQSADNGRFELLPPATKSEIEPILASIKKSIDSWEGSPNQTAIFLQKILDRYKLSFPSSVPAVLS
jgi:hypothetical protein